MNPGSARRALCASDNLALYDRYELLELRRDDGVQTFHARDIETARPVQLHLFTQDESSENLALLSRLDYLPEAERRRVIERGEYQGRPYVITDRLAGYPGFREWLTVRTDASVRNSSLDGQFHQLFDPPGVEDAEPASLTAIGPAALSLDEQFYRLFDPPGMDAETAWVTTIGPTAESISVPEPGIPSLTGGAGARRNGEQGGTQPSRMVPAAAKSLLGIVLGIVAAILVLGLLVAAIAFRRW